MSQTIGSTFSGHFNPDVSVQEQGSMIAEALKRMLAESAELGGDEQQIEVIEFELDDSVGWNNLTAFTMRVKTRLR